MSMELIFALVTMSAVLLVAAHAWSTWPQYEALPETVEVGPVTVAPPPPPPSRHDVLDDYAVELNFEALTAESSAEHRLALLDALLAEADHETVRLEFLVNKLGNQLVPAA